MKISSVILALFIFGIGGCLDSYAGQGCCSWHHGESYCDKGTGRIICSDGFYSSCPCDQSSENTYFQPPYDNDEEGEGQDPDDP